MTRYNNSFKNIGFQYFADEPGAQNNQQQQEDNNQNQNQDNNQNQNQNQNQNEPGKSYTQDQLHAMMANEKRTARTALLKELGFDIKDDKSFKATMKDIKKTLDAGKTQAQLDKEAKEQAEAAKNEAESKANHLQLKVDCLSAHVNPDDLDDVIVLVQSKVNDTYPVAKALEDLKAKYPQFFDEGGSAGTGNSNNPARNRHNNGSEGIGARLAKSNKNTIKSTYFKN